MSENQYPAGEQPLQVIPPERLNNPTVAPADDLAIPAFLKRPTPGAVAPTVTDVQEVAPPVPVTTPAPLPTLQGVDVEKYVAQYVKLRDKIKAIEDAQSLQLKPFREMRGKLDALLLDHMQRQNTKSMRTEAGTISVLDTVTCSVEDASAFREHVIEQQAWDLADMGPNKAATLAFLEENQALPPGVKTSSFRKLGVRRA